MKPIIKKYVPDFLYRPFLNRLRRPRKVRWGNLRSLVPFSNQFGFDRGLPIDRYYITAFLKRHEQDIRGRVLEIAEPIYTKQFGGDRVSRSDVLHAVPGNSQATLVGDLMTGQGIPMEIFDCIILTQTLLVIERPADALFTAYHALKPGGVLLASFPGISQISRYDMDRWGDYWRFTDASARKLFESVFGSGNVQIETHGNVLAACAFLHGLAAHELREEELNHHDPDYQVLITVRAIKSQV